MIHNFLGKCKYIFIDSIDKLKSADRRIVAKEFNVSRDTIRKDFNRYKR